MSQRPTILLACSDLIFGSKVEVTAKNLGAEVHRAPASLDELHGEREYSLAIVDLDGARPDPEPWIRELRSRFPSLPIVGFVRHDRVERIRGAREAGATKVLSRGAFSDKLPDLVGGNV